MRERICEEIRARKIITIVRGVYGEDAVRLAQALAAGGIGILEVTFDAANPRLHDRTLGAISRIRAEMGGAMLVGAGTVLTPDQVDMAHDAGAQFVVSPDANALVIQRAIAQGMASLPGALTPGEIRAAYDWGADFVKLFPAAQMGVEYIKAIRAPLNQIPLLAVGGVDEHNVLRFLEAGCAGVGVGGNLVNKQWIGAGEFDRITALAQTYCDAIAGAND